MSLSFLPLIFCLSFKNVNLIFSLWAVWDGGSDLAHRQQFSDSWDRGHWAEWLWMPLPTPISKGPLLNPELLCEAASRRQVSLLSCVPSSWHSDPLKGPWGIPTGARGSWPESWRGQRESEDPWVHFYSAGRGSLWGQKEVSQKWQEGIDRPEQGWRYVAMLSD